MALNISPEIEAQIAARVASGEYFSADQVLQESLRLLEDRDYLLARRKAQLDAEIQKGLDSLAAGRVITSEQLQQRIAKRREALIAKPAQ